MKKHHILYILTISIITTAWLSIKAGAPLEKLLTGIYQKLSEKPPQHFQNDSLGVPYIVFEGKLGKQYNAVAVSEQALKQPDDTSGGVRFFSCVKWLMNNSIILNDSSIIYLDRYDWPSYQMTSPWRSAMNQGRAMQAFLKAYEKTHDTLYLGYARRSMNTLYTEVKDGGVTYKDSLGYWYEEYADDKVPQSRVLNGMIVVIQALSDYYGITQEHEAKFLFDQGVKSVKNTLSLYDVNGHSNYDRLGRPAKSWYHKFHIELLDFLYKKTNDPVFNEYKQKWLQYKEPSYLTNLFMKPTRIGAFTVFSLFVAVFALVFGGFFILHRMKFLFSDRLN